MPLLRILQHAEMRVSRSLVFAQTELSPCIIALDVLTNNVVVYQPDWTYQSCQEIRFKTCLYRTSCPGGLCTVTIVCQGLCVMRPRAFAALSMTQMSVTGSVTVTTSDWKIPLTA